MSTYLAALSIDRQKASLVSFACKENNVGIRVVKSSQLQAKITTYFMISASNSAGLLLALNFILAKLDTYSNNKTKATYFKTLWQPCCNLVHHSIKPSGGLFNIM